MSTEVGSELLTLAQGRGPKAIKTHLGVQGENDLVNVGTLGQPITVQPHQALDQAQARQYKFYEKDQGGTISNVLSSGIRLDIDQQPQGIQKPDLFFVKLTLQTTAGEVRIPSIPLLFNYLEIRPNQGQQALGKPYGENFFFNLLTIDPDQIAQLGETMGINEDWVHGITLTTTPREVSFPILGQWIAQGSSFFSAEFKKEIRWEWTFRSDSVVEGTAANVQLTSMQIVSLYHNVDKTIRDQFSSKPSRGKHIRYSDYSISKKTLTLTAGSEATFELSGIVGKFSYLFVLIKPVGATGSSPFRNAFTYYYPWDRIGLSEPGGQKMLGGTDINWHDFKNYWFPRMFPNAPKFIKRYNIGAIFFAEDPNADVQQGVATGSHIMKGKEQLTLTPPAAAPVNASLTYTPQNSQTGVAANPDNGSFKIRFTDPVSRKSETTAAIAYNATTAQIQAAVYRLSNWMGVLNVTGTFDAGAVQFDFAGHYSGVAITDAEFEVLPAFGLAATAPLKVSLTASTAAVRGFTTGTYDVIVYGWNRNFLEFIPMGVTGNEIEYAKHKE